MQEKSLLSKFNLMILFFSFLIMGCHSYQSKQNPSELWLPSYPMIHSSYNFNFSSVDGSIPLANLKTAPNSNGSRGFRGEVYITLDSHEAYPGSGEDPYAFLQADLGRFQEDEIGLLQCYVYLTHYALKPISQSAFAELKDYLQTIHDQGYKILLRFAYQTGATKIVPATAQIVAHCRQIHDFFFTNAENERLFHETVYAVQLGMMGLWGEGHGSPIPINTRRVAKAVAQMLPERVPLMLRTPEMLQQVPEPYQSRYGLHDDYLIGYSHPWGMMDFNNPNYPLLIQRCKYFVNDAEMPWGRAQVPINTIGLLRQCVNYGLTSLSIEHNYKESGERYHLQQWKEEFISLSQLEENHFPYNPSLLENDQISIYNYLKHHLGYQLVASNLKLPSGASNSQKAQFLLTNYGMAAPFGFEMHLFIDGVEVSTEPRFVETQLLQFGQQEYQFHYSGGKIELQFVNRRDSRETIRLYNDLPYVNGKNLLKK